MGKKGTGIGKCAEIRARLGSVEGENEKERGAAGETRMRIEFACSHTLTPHISHTPHTWRHASCAGESRISGQGRPTRDPFVPRPPDGLAQYLTSSAKTMDTRPLRITVW